MIYQEPQIKHSSTELLIYGLCAVVYFFLRFAFKLFATIEHEKGCKGILLSVFSCAIVQGILLKNALLAVFFRRT